MKDTITKHFRAERWLYLFIGLHLILWTLIPAIVRNNLPMDSIEGTIWGHQLEWGYDKNPFMNGWLTALAVHLGDPSGWVIYLFSELSVIICFWMVWRLAKQMLPSIYALCSVLLLESIQYYNFHAIDFNDNTLELSLWTLTIYCFYQALRSTRTWMWVLTGLFAGLSMMTKYYTLALFAPMIILLIMDTHQRKQFTQPGLYLALLTFLIIILPHTIWLFFNHFITVTYVFERASSPPTWTNHFFFPAQFIWQQLEAFLPAVILVGLLWIIPPYQRSEKPIIHSFDRKFLWMIGIGPFLLTAALSLLLGIKLRAGWGMPLMSLWGILLFALIPPVLTKTKIYSFIAVIFILMGLLLTGYSRSLTDSSTSSSANFPGRAIALTLTQQWHATFHTRLAYVAGPRWVNGNIEFYSPDHPSVFMEWSTWHAPWINVNDLKRKGALFVWNISNGATLPPTVQQEFPRLSKITIMQFNWQRNKHHLAPIEIGVAVLPPQTTKLSS